MQNMILKMMTDTLFILVSVETKIKPETSAARETGFNRYPVTSIIIIIIYIFCYFLLLTFT